MPKPKDARDHDVRKRLFELLLGAELVGVSALALSAVRRTGRETGLDVPVSHSPSKAVSVGQTYIALAADHLVAVELACQSLQRGLNDTTTETEDEVESRLL